MGPIGVFALRVVNREVRELLSGISNLPEGFLVYDRALELAWAHRIAGAWFVGIRGRASWSRVLAFSGKGGSLDLGLQGRLSRWLRVGFSSRDLLATFSADDFPTSRPPVDLAAGAALGPLELDLFTLDIYWTARWIPKAHSAGAAAAVEGRIANVLALRVGYGRSPAVAGDVLSEWSLGLGLRVGPFRLDLARRTGNEAAFSATTYVTGIWQPAGASLR